MYVLFAAVITVVLSGICLESYKRHRDRQGVASAVSGEIYSILHMQEKRQTARFFAMLLPRLDAGEKIPFPDITGSGGDALKLDPVIEKHIDRIGLLPDNLPERIATFYSYTRGIRIDIMNLSKGVFPDPAPQANIIRADLALWADAEQLGASLGIDLRRTASESWWPLARWEQAKTQGLGLVYAVRARIKGPPNEIAIPPQPAADAAQAPLDQVLTGAPTPTIALFAPPYQEFVTEIELHINNRLPELMVRLGRSREEAFRHIAIDYFAALHLERASRSIFGSQTDALTFLSTNNSRATIEEIRRFYTTAAMLLPAVYANYPFENWLGFLQAWELINVQEDFVTLRPAGKALIPYMQGRGYLASRPVG